MNDHPRQEAPLDIEALRQLCGDKSSYVNRLGAIELLGNYKSQQSIDLLRKLMINDKIHRVQHRAFLKLQAFGENVRLPKKKKGKLVKDIEKKLYRIADKVEFDQESVFYEEFKKLYPEEFDIYSCEKGTKMNEWVSNVLKSRPK